MCAITQDKGSKNFSSSVAKTNKETRFKRFKGANFAGGEKQDD
ncbi:MAG: hypothetical protein AB1668_00895 [Nanoarchaeota archaeon]